MIVGYEEAMMMKEEKLITGPGSIIKDFFGVPEMKVVGILAPTGTILDQYHIVNSETFNQLISVAKVETLLAPDGSTKLFYMIEKNIPEKLQANIPTDGLNAFYIGGKKYTPIYIGADEAEMMIQENLFKEEGDLIEGFFGNDVVISGVLPKTNTILDNVHFVQEGVVLKK